MLKGEANLCVPSLHFWEFGNVLRTYVRRGELERSIAQEIYQLHLESPLVPMEPDQHKTLECAFDYDATMYDAVYIALCRSLDVPLITAEKTTRPWVVKLGDNVRVVL